MMIISVIINWQPCRWFIWNFQKFSLIQTPASHGWKIFSKPAEDDENDNKDDDGDEDDEDDNDVFVDFSKLKTV